MKFEKLFGADPSSDLEDPPATAKTRVEPAATWNDAGQFSRALALLLDATVIVSLCSLGIPAANFFIPDPEFLEDLGFVIAWSIAVTIGYLCLPVFSEGRSLGKKALSLHVVRMNGAPVTRLFAFVRQSLLFLELIALGGLMNMSLGNFGSWAYALALPAIDFLWPLWGPNNQTLHDKLVGSRVVKASDDPRLEGVPVLREPS